MAAKQFFREVFVKELQTAIAHKRTLLTVVAVHRNSRFPMRYWELIVSSVEETEEGFLKIVARKFPVPRHFVDINITVKFSGVTFTPKQGMIGNYLTIREEAVIDVSGW